LAKAKKKIYNDDEVADAWGNIFEAALKSPYREQRIKALEAIITNLTIMKEDAMKDSDYENVAALNRMLTDIHERLEKELA
jgi:hypothetical protein